MAKLRANSYIIMDFETGGLIMNGDKRIGEPNSRYFPITEFAAIALRGDDLSEILSYENLIKPYDPNLEYGEVAAQITGISKEMCEEHGVSLMIFMEDFTTICKESNEIAGRYQKAVIVGHNLGFDVPFLLDAAERCKIDLSKLLDGHINHKGDFMPRYLDTEKICLNMWGSDTGMKSFNLPSCCDRAGIDIVDAHRAMNDVIPNTDLFRYTTNKIRSIQSSNMQSNSSELAREHFQI